MRNNIVYNKRKESQERVMSSKHPSRTFDRLQQRIESCRTRVRESAAERQANWTSFAASEEYWSKRNL